MTGSLGGALPTRGYWPNIEPRFWRGQLVERHWPDGRLGCVLGWDDEDHCWVRWEIRATPGHVEIECVAADDVIAWHPINLWQAARLGLSDPPVED